MSSEPRQRKKQREEHKDHCRDHCRFFERLLSPARAESRLAARSAESRRHISAFSRLQQDNQNQKDADQNEYKFENDDQG